MSAADPSSGSPLVVIGRYAFRYRDALLPIALLGLAALWHPPDSPAGRRLDQLAFTAGVALTLAGQSLRALVIGLSYIIRGGRNRTAYAERLVQEGIFGHCRNPLYVGNACIQTGMLLAINDVWAYLIGLPLIALVYRAIVAAEEHFLAEAFGDAYRDYCARVPRFGFRFSGLRATMRAAPFDWPRVVRKEYGTPFAWISILIAIAIYKEVRTVGFEASVPVIEPALVIWSVAVAAYLVARTLKKANRLGSD